MILAVMRNVISAALLLTALFLDGCATADAHRDAEVLMQADRDFNVAVAQRRLDAWAEHFAPNGSQMSESGKLVTGDSAIRAHMAPAFGDSNFRLEWEPLRAEISNGGKLGTTWGRWTAHGVRDGREEITTGNYVTVWRKQPDGSWKIVFDTGDSDP
jgi:ketosteroid isomerase-like protein